MLVKEYIARFKGLQSTIVVFRDDAHKEIARGHLNGIMRGIELPYLNRDYTLKCLLECELQYAVYDATFPYEFLTIYVGKW